MTDVNLNDEIKEIDEAIAKEETKIKRGEALKRLKNNPDYKLVIEEGYIEAEAKRLFGILTSPPLHRRDMMENIQDALLAITNFKSYVGTSTYDGIVMREAENAPSVIEENKLVRNDLTKPKSVEG